MAPLSLPAEAALCYHGTGRPGNRQEAAHNPSHRQLSRPSVSRREVSSWARQRKTRGMESRTAAQVRSFKLTRSQGPPSKPKPRGHGPRSKAGVSSYAGQRTSQTLNSWGHVTGKRWGQPGTAGPKRVSALAAEERGQAEALSSRNRRAGGPGRQVGAKQPDSESDARAR